MEIMVNGKPARLEEGARLSEFLSERGFSPGGAIVEYNGEIVSAEQWESIALTGEDRLEIVTFVGGG